MGRLCFGEYELDYFNWPLYLAELNIYWFPVGAPMITGILSFIYNMYPPVK